MSTYNITARAFVTITVEADSEDEANDAARAALAAVEDDVLDFGTIDILDTDREDDEPDDHSARKEDARNAYLTDEVAS